MGWACKRAGTAVAGEELNFDPEVCCGFLGFLLPCLLHSTI